MTEPITVAVKRAYPSFIAGLAYESPTGTDRRRYCACLQVGSTLELVPEPTNAHDPDAIALVHDGHHLGYVPAKHRWVAESLAEGDELICLVESVGIDDADPDCAYRVGLQIGIVSDGDDIPALFLRETPEMRAARERQDLEDTARRCCVDGLRVLVYLSMVDGVRSPEEANIQASIIESRLAMTGIDRDPALLVMLTDLTATLAPTKSSMARSVNIVAKDPDYLRLIYGAAVLIADFDDTVDASEAEVMKRLVAAAQPPGGL